MGFNQPLLNGFGYRANAKFIRIAKNDLRLADSTFKQQVITTVANVVNLYSDLVSFKENVRVAQQALAYAQKLLEDNKRQVEIGTLAPIEVVRAESEVASDEQALIVAQTGYQQQQELLKTAISKHVDADLTGAVVEPVDKLPEPNPSDIPTLDVALKEAEANRPELVTADNNIRNQEITIQASRNGLLPSLTLFGTYAPTGLSGNQLVCPSGTSLSTSTRTCSPGGVAPTILQNGIWQSLSQGFRGKYPDYSFGLNLQIPIRNRAAQADMTTALLQERQLKVQLQQQKNTIAQDVRNAEIAVTQARAGVAAATKATQLAQETYDAEKKKFQLGESTVFNVILTQRDLATAEGNEVKARSTYSKALTQFGQATATILDKYGIEFADAKNGQSSHVHNIPGTHETSPPSDTKTP
jgi:outer membrane protein TolC